MNKGEQSDQSIVNTDGTSSGVMSGENCPELDIQVEKINEQGDCCTFEITISLATFSANFNLVNILVDGASPAPYSQGFGVVTYRVNVCEDPVSLQVYYDEEECISHVLICDCCSTLTITESYVFSEDSCCVVSLNIDDPTGCWTLGVTAVGKQMSFNYNNVVGPPPGNHITWRSDGADVKICDPDQTIQFEVWVTVNSSKVLCFRGQKFSYWHCIP